MSDRGLAQLLEAKSAAEANDTFTVDGGVRVRTSTRFASGCVAKES